MTEEEIKHNAWKKSVEHYGTSETKESTAYEKGYIEGANLILSQLTEKVKQIENAKEVFTDNERLLFENADLKKQIEKMKCCDNCDYFVSKKEGYVCEKGSIYQFCIGKTCTDWKLKE